MKTKLSLALMGLTALAVFSATPAESQAQAFSLDLGFFRKGTGAHFHYNTAPPPIFVAPAPRRHIIHHFEPPCPYHIHQRRRPVIVEHHHYHTPGFGHPGRGRGVPHHHRYVFP